MKSQEKIPVWEDIIFEKRNKMYGAYELRTQYNARLARAFVITLAGSLLIFLFLHYPQKTPLPHSIEKIKENVIFTQFDFFENVPHTENNKPAPTPTPKPDAFSFVPVNDSVILTPIDTSANISVISSDSVTGPSSPGPFSDTILSAENSTDRKDTFSQASVDKEPEFPGGMEKFYKFLKNRIHYTDEAKRARLTVKMYISFVIDEEGLLSNIRIRSKAGFGLDEEVVSALLGSPQWLPGIVRNMSVKTEMILPVSFNLVQ